MKVQWQVKGYEQIFEPIETAPERLTDAFSLF